MATQNIVTAGAEDAVRTFAYKARNLEGKEVSGTAKAINGNDVTRELLRQNLTPLKVKARGSESGGGPKRAKARSIVIASRQLAAMIDAGLKYPEAIEVVRKDCEDLALASALAEVSLDIQAGTSLSSSMAKHPYVFPDMMVNLVTAGESAGTVRESMLRVADSLEKADELKAKIKKACMYPGIVLLIASFMFAGMMLFIVPAFAKTYEELSDGKVGLPMLTQLVISASEIMKWAVPAFAFVMIFVVIWYRRHSREEWLRLIVDPIKFKIPVFGNLFHKIALARFCHNMSGLEGSGVDRLEALQITAKTIGNITMERVIMEARDAQRRGEQLAPILSKEPLFPSMIISMVEAGEKSGQVAHMLEKTAVIYDRDVDTITDNMAELINPLLLLMVGGMVMVIVIAIYLPYIKIGQVI